MELSDFFKLRALVHVKFTHWFSFNRKHRVLYCHNWFFTDQELKDLNDYVDPFGCTVLSCSSCSVFIIPKSYK